ncbi:hypothetical protein COU60_02675 [Candidatus Pacearchaeota archaeon CG10_big_fil_rev_8_21_14_0_10_34_76]|nr:MAG: hypothetical protein COU60_02675 [Candidatus Pacearchaeota archaeon CG10_big_fil_rev_8_21_14_0_10_34_76]
MFLTLNQLIRTLQFDGSVRQPHDNDRQNYWSGDYPEVSSSDREEITAPPLVRKVDSKGYMTYHQNPTSSDENH